MNMIIMQLGFMAGVIMIMGPVLGFAMLVIMCTIIIHMVGGVTMAVQSAAILI